MKIVAFLSGKKKNTMVAGITKYSSYFYNLNLSFLKKLKKKIAKKFIRKTNFNYGWFGNYSTWSEAKEECTGYSAEPILEKCRNSLLKVKNKQAVYERDSVLFDKIEYSWPLLAGLLYITAKNKGKLDIIDFGGSLGSTFFQNQLFLKEFQVTWTIIEQQHFVDCGKKHFENETLKFSNSLKKSLKRRKTNAILFSSVLQYVEDPLSILKIVFTSDVEYLIIDRTAFSEDGKMITVQRVHPDIYNASYPAWFFSETEFKSWFSSFFELVAEFDDSFTPSQIINSSSRVYWKGFIYKRLKKHGNTR